VSDSTLITLAYVILLILLLLVAGLLAKVRKLEKKVIDVSPKDLYPFIEELRELVIESERVASKLDTSIKDRESVLEDLTALLDTKLAGYNRAADKTATEKSLKDKIKELAAENLTDADIARRLGISTTEVKIVRSMDS
jgi:uncharacterized protein (DUF3084 family)